MTNDMVEFVSVCRISEDYNGRIWLTRIADINDQQLSVPYKSNRSTTYFENRDRLYRNDGPSQVDTIGVWRWTATPNLNDSETDYVQSFFVSDILPIRVVVSQDVKSTQKLIESLKDGSVWTKPYICDTLFCYERTWGNFIGVLKSLLSATNMQSLRILPIHSLVFPSRAATFTIGMIRIYAL